MIYIKKFDYGSLVRGERKKAETANGRFLLKQAVYDMYSLNTDNLTIALGEHGKPYFKDNKDLRFNLSHSGDYAAVIVGNVCVGIDIQVIQSVKDRLIEKLCNAVEREYIYDSDDKSRAFIELWTLKESYLKALGMGMSFPMDKINFDVNKLSDNHYGRISNQSGIYYIYRRNDYVLSACILDNSISDSRAEEIFRRCVL